MSLSVGIVGLPNVGKSTLLNALTHAGAEASNYPFCTIENNVGVAAVPDPDLIRLEQILEPEEAIPTSVRFVDIAGLVEGASRGEGLGNKFLAHIREVDAIIHVVRCFDDENVIHSPGSPDPLRDVGIVETELLLADLETAKKNKEHWIRTVHHGTGAGKLEAAAFAHAEEALKNGVEIIDHECDEKERLALSEVSFLTAKPRLYVANTGEDDPSGTSGLGAALREAKGSERVIPVAVEIEEEISQLSPEEQNEFLQDLGLEETALHHVIRACYRLLDLITFYTIANNKLRAWQLPAGGVAAQAAGKIHSDMEKGFIRAEVMALANLVELGSRHALHEKGLIQIVGRDHVVQDRDVIQIHFKA